MTALAAVLGQLQPQGFHLVAQALNFFQRRGGVRGAFQLLDLLFELLHDCELFGLVCHRL